MKTTRLLALLASLALSTATFAADAATAFSLKGQARVKTGEGYTLLAVGNGISEGSFIQVGAKSKLGVKTADGSTVFFGENSAFRLRYVADSGPGSLEITLLSGTVSGNFNTGASGSTVLRTAAGVVDTNNASVQITYAPGPNGTPGKLNVFCTVGSAKITVNGREITVPAGSTFNGTEVAVMTADELAAATGAVAGGTTDAKIQSGPSNAPTPSTPPTVVPNLAVVSPNGEGQQP